MHPSATALIPETRKFIASSVLIVDLVATSEKNSFKELIAAFWVIGYKSLKPKNTAKSVAAITTSLLWKTLPSFRSSRRFLGVAFSVFSPAESANAHTPFCSLKYALYFTLTALSLQIFSSKGERQ